MPGLWFCKTFDEQYRFLQAILAVLAKRYNLLPTGTKRKAIKAPGKHYVLACLVYLGYFSLSQAWAGVEAGVMRGMAVHALLLAKRAAGSKSLSPIIWHCDFLQRVISGRAGVQSCA